MARVPDSSTYSLILSNLRSSVIYEFEILAYTIKGLGPKSSSVRAMTLESGKDLKPAKQVLMFLT